MRNEIEVVCLISSPDMHVWSHFEAYLKQVTRMRNLDTIEMHAEIKAEIRN